MQNKSKLWLILCLLVALICLTVLAACSGDNSDEQPGQSGNYVEGDVIIDDKDMDYLFFDSDTGYGYAYTGKKYVVKYLVKDKSNSYVTLEGEDANSLMLTSSKGAIKNLSLKEIEETVQINDASISIVGIGESAFKGNLTLTTVDLTKAKGALEFTIEDHAFEGCAALTTVTLPSQVYIGTDNRVGAHAFDSCQSLATVNITSSFDDIGEYAFYGCQSLESITLPESVSVIREGTFAMCDSLSQFSGASSVRSIQNGAFMGTDFTEFDFDSFNNIVYIGANAFNGTKLSQVKVPDTVTYIGSGAFQNIVTLQSVQIPFLQFSAPGAPKWAVYPAQSL